jgi:Na+/proline symporter
LADEEFATIWALQEVLHPVIGAIALAGLVAAVISSADSALHSVSASMSRDIFQMVLKPEASDRAVLSMSKICVGVVGVAGIGIGILVPNVIQALLVGYSLTAAGLFFPLVVGHYWKGATRNGAIAGMIAGVLVTLLFRIIENPVSFIPGVAMGLLASALAMVAVSVAGRGKDSVPAT